MQEHQDRAIARLYPLVENRTASWPETAGTAPRYPAAMKIRDVKTFPTFIGRNQLIVKVETDEGLYGWCEAHYIDLMPHNPLGAICTAATVHLAAAVTNFAWMECRTSPTESLCFNNPEFFPVQIEQD